MPVAKVQMFIDDELVLDAETEDLPLQELRPLFFAITSVLAEGVHEGTDLTPIN